MITYCPQRVLHCLPLAFPLPHLRGEVPEINVKREVDGMSDKPPLSARETLSEWAERAWQSRRAQGRGSLGGTGSRETIPAGWPRTMGPETQIRSRTRSSSERPNGWRKAGF